MSDYRDIQVFNALLAKAIEAPITKIPVNRHGAEIVLAEVIKICAKASEISGIIFDSSQAQVDMEWRGFGDRIPSVTVKVHNQELVKWMRENGIEGI